MMRLMMRVKVVFVLTLNGSKPYIPIFCISCIIVRRQTRKQVLACNNTFSQSKMDYVMRIPYGDTVILNAAYDGFAILQR